MEIIKTKVTHEWQNGELVEKDNERIEAVIFINKDGDRIIESEDLSSLIPISGASIKNYVRSKHVLHYYMGQKWFINLDDFFEKGKRIL